MQTYQGCRVEMENIQFSVQGSSVDPYEVTFVREGNKLTAFCNCHAGENGTYCKHRLAILAGNVTAIVSSNIDQVATVASWLPGTILGDAIAELNAAEKILEQVKARISMAKRELSAALHGR